VGNDQAFSVGQRVRYLPPHRTDGEIYEYALHSGLSPRKLYRVIAIEGEAVVVEGGRDHFTSFKGAELDHKFARDDSWWEAQKKRIDERHKNYFKNTQQLTPLRSCGAG
jgi:hypothetical protein